LRRNLTILFFAVTLLVANSIAVAQQSPKQIYFVVNKFEVLGDNPLTEAETQDVFKYFVGEHYGLDGVEAAATAFQQKLRQKGFTFFQVNLAPQKLEDGTIKLQLIELKIEKVEVEGNQYFSKQNLSRNIPSLRVGETPNTRVLSRAINMANRQPSKMLKLQFAESESGNAINAKLKVTELNPNFAFVTLNNTGNEETGNFRLAGGFQFSNLFDRDHNLSLSYTTSPDDFSAVQQYSATYNMPFYEIGGEVNVFISRSDVDSGIVANNISVSGAGTMALLHYKHTFLQSGAYKQQLDVGLDHKLFENDVGFLGIPISGTGDVLSRPFSLAYIGFWQGAGNSLNFNIAAFQNLSGGSNNTDADYNDLRQGATADWSLFRYGFGYDQLFSKNWFIRFNLYGQQSSDRLISGEQFGIGGLYSVRGFDQRSLLGDSGYQSSLELWMPGFGQSTFRPIVFYDFGSVELNTPLISETPSLNISSVGAGIRWSIINKFNLILDVAYVTDGAEEINKVAPSSEFAEKGDVKGHIDVFYRF
jgi:hemolysin activation/secretion protein